MPIMDYVILIVLKHLLLIILIIPVLLVILHAKLVFNILVNVYHAHLEASLNSPALVLALMVLIMIMVSVNIVPLNVLLALEILILVLHALKVNFYSTENVVPHVQLL